MSENPSVPAPGNTYPKFPWTLQRCMLSLSLSLSLSRSRSHSFCVSVSLPLSVSLSLPLNLSPHPQAHPWEWPAMRRGSQATWRRHGAPAETQKPLGACGWVTSGDSSLWPSHLPAEVSSWSKHKPSCCVESEFLTRGHRGRW